MTNSDVRERPILFNGDMVRAILDGRKTQTRRLMKPQPEPSPHGGHWWACDTVESMVKVEEQLNNDGSWAGFAGSVCPYGQTGERLWVRETHHLSHQNKVIYKADYSFNPFREDECGEDCSMVGEVWRPSIHMPRWASRITLEIANVRVERIQDISDEDALAEGILNSTLQTPPTNTVMYHCGPWPTPICGESARDAYGALWESIYGKDGWDQNPWVWVIEFRRANQVEVAA
ncbi:hypothetical protein [Microbulbifer sp. VVAC002]|uniref:hypothetical protein n=1 Tax=Microbulbifer sp. VVAC002 TaxID=3243387 RepID=UPI00403A112C